MTPPEGLPPLPPKATVEDAIKLGWTSVEKHRLGIRGVPPGIEDDGTESVLDWFEHPPPLPLSEEVAKTEEAPMTDAMVRRAAEDDDCSRAVALCRRLETSLTAARAEVERLQNTDQRVPGMWGCRTCGFVQMRSILYAGNGAIGANTETLMEPCPNDGDVMFPYTYKQLAKENQDIGEAAVIRARNLEEELTTLREENSRLREWKPISTAPKDGTAILIADAAGVSICRFRHQAGLLPGGWHNGNLFWSGEYAPVGWMSLPAAPESKGGEDE